MKRNVRRQVTQATVIQAGELGLQHVVNATLRNRIDFTLISSESRDKELRIY